MDGYSRFADRKHVFIPQRRTALQVSVPGSAGGEKDLSNGILSLFADYCGENCDVFIILQDNPGVMASDNRKINVLTNAGIWLLLIFFTVMVLPMTWGVKVPVAFVAKQLLQYGFMIVAYYFNARYVVPRTLLRNRIGWFVGWLVAVLAVALLLNEWLEHSLHIYEKVARSFGDAHARPPHRPRGLDWFIMMSTLLTLGVSTAVAAITRWQKDALLREELEKEKVKSELSFLKAQINPHFFFNTLNNIYSLSFIDINGSQEALLKLSRMMRYLLYETGNDTTLLSKELSFVHDYIQLMRLRMQDNTHILFEEPQSYNDVQIAPMILLPYIENAFKHGVSATGENLIEIRISVGDGRLELLVNNKIHRTLQREHSFTERSGIGLQNTERRLQLLYPAQHRLEIEEAEEEGTYAVRLNLDLQ